MTVRDIVGFLIIFYCAFFATGGPSATARTIGVGDSSDLQRALRDARCGQTIVLADGVYTGNVTIAADCSADEPLVVRSARPLAARMSSLLHVQGSHIHVRGLYFLGPNAHMTTSGDHHAIIGNKFEGWATYVALTLGAGRQAEVAYNEFTNPDPFTTGQLGDYPLRIGIRSSHRAEAFHSGAHVHHNYFHDFPAKPDPAQYNSGQSDAIEVCFTGSLIASNWLIEYNLIERHQQGHGIIDVKCAGGTTVRFNTIVDSPGGQIDFRNGYGGKMIANWIENAGGIAIFGGGHEIAGNVLAGASRPQLYLGAGDVASDGVQSDREAANNNRVVCNTGNHIVGVWASDNISIAAHDNEVSTENGDITLLHETRTRADTIVDCSRYPEARRLSRHEVGPLALT